MITYMNLSLHDLNNLFIYDKERGKVLLRENSKIIGSDTGVGLVHKMRDKNKVYTLSLGKMCYILHHEVEVDKYDKIAYLDGDYTNLRPDNLSLSRKIRHTPVESRPEPVMVSERIYYDPVTCYFVVRRGYNQSVYRADTLTEAIKIRNEWLTDKNIHRWDKTCDKFSKYL